MASTNLLEVPKTQRFTESETESLFAKVAECCAGIEAEWQAYNSGDAKQGSHIDNIRTLSQVAGFVADHAGEDCAYYGDIFHWLDIPRGSK